MSNVSWAPSMVSLSTLRARAVTSVLERLDTRWGWTRWGWTRAGAGHAGAGHAGAGRARAALRRRRAFTRPRTREQVPGAVCRPGSLRADVAPLDGAAQLIGGGEDLVERCAAHAADLLPHRAATYRTVLQQSPDWPCHHDQAGASWRGRQACSTEVAGGYHRGHDTSLHSPPAGCPARRAVPPWPFQPISAASAIGSAG
jgi:hypothetical protein